MSIYRHISEAKQVKGLSVSLREINPIVRGWLNYYGRFYRSRLIQSLRRIDDYLVRWAMRKYKRLRGKLSRAWELLHAVQGRQPQLFAHWKRPQPQAG